MFIYPGVATGIATLNKIKIDNVRHSLEREEAFIEKERRDLINKLYDLYRLNNISG